MPRGLEQSTESGGPYKITLGRKGVRHQVATCQEKVLFRPQEAEHPVLGKQPSVSTTALTCRQPDKLFILYICLFTEKINRLPLMRVQHMASELGHSNSRILSYIEFLLQKTVFNFLHNCLISSIYSSSVRMFLSVVICLTSSVLTVFKIQLYWFLSLKLLFTHFCILCAWWWAMSLTPTASLNFYCYLLLVSVHLPAK